MNRVGNFIEELTYSFVPWSEVLDVRRDIGPTDFLKSDYSLASKPERR